MRLQYTVRGVPFIEVPDGPRLEGMVALALASNVHERVTLHWQGGGQLPMTERVSLESHDLTTIIAQRGTEKLGSLDSMLRVYREKEELSGPHDYKTVRDLKIAGENAPVKNFCAYVLKSTLTTSKNIQALLLYDTETEDAISFIQATVFSVPSDTIILPGAVVIASRCRIDRKEGYEPTGVIPDDATIVSSLSGLPLGWSNARLSHIKAMLEKVSRMGELDANGYTRLYTCLQRNHVDRQDRVSPRLLQRYRNFRQGVVERGKVACIESAGIDEHNHITLITGVSNDRLTLRLRDVQGDALYRNRVVEAIGNLKPYYYVYQAETTSNSLEVSNGLKGGFFYSPLVYMHLFPGTTVDNEPQTQHVHLESEPIIISQPTLDGPCLSSVAPAFSGIERLQFTPCVVYTPSQHALAITELSETTRILTQRISLFLGAFIWDQRRRRVYPDYFPSRPNSQDLFPSTQISLLSEEFLLIGIEASPPLEEETTTYIACTHQSLHRILTRYVHEHTLAAIGVNPTQVGDRPIQGSVNTPLSITATLLKVEALEPGQSTYFLLDD
ncbi:hypothetical protein GMRT_15612 [Giardia muris]|uniref:Uncharacterized protein n=1 Tax=Giardia muris TaxID=5742 RepID=A0A4Z1T6N0_GIAMU|nr:hypothetical protein GMRT_15612 [Giardia muris]|eukprot:TNJ28797.1 hypothetical protein GMRT_15612 [Giardia muris]